MPRRFAIAAASTAFLLAVSLAGPLAAQDPVGALKDLVGAKGGMAEGQIVERGFEHVRTDKSEAGVYSYWTETSTGNCVAIRTEDGRYQSIVWAPASDCGGGAESAAAGGDSKDEFHTVCGVITDDGPTRSKCKAVDHVENGRKHKTVLFMPDQNLALIWKGGNKVIVRVEGLAERHGTYSTSEGETDIFVEGQTYYYYSDKSLAKREVQSL